MAGISSADPLATNHTNKVAASGVAALDLQVIQTSARLLHQPTSKTTLADLQSLVALAQKYFLARKKIEEPLFRQQLQSQHHFGHSDDYEDQVVLGQQQSPSVQQTLITVFQQYISAHNATNHASSGVVASDVATLTQLRNLLRQLQAMNQGHLSGSTWLYNSPLPVFAAQNLLQLDKRIIETTLSSAAVLRKKHKYAPAIKLYKTLLADYVNTPYEAPVKVLLDAAIVEDYNYQAKLALAKHDYKKARAALKKIVALYPDSDYAAAAEKAMQATVSQAVRYFKQEGDANFHPQGHPGVPQKKAALFYSSMFQEDPSGPVADYALYYWARSLGTEGNTKEALTHLQDFAKKFPRSKMRPDALFLQGFLLASPGINQYSKAAEIMTEFVRLYPHHALAGDALWYCAFYHAYGNHFKEALACLEQLKKYPKDKHQKHIAQWESTFRNKIQTGEKWP